MPRPRSSKPETLLSLEEAAALLGVPRPHPDREDAKEHTPLRIKQRRAVLRLVREGSLTGVEIAGSWRIHGSSVEALIAGGGEL